MIFIGTEIYYVTSKRIEPAKQQMRKRTERWLAENREAIDDHPRSKNAKLFGSWRK